MSTHSRLPRPDWLHIVLSVIVLLAMTLSVSAAPQGPAPAAAEQRTSKSLHIRSGGRANRDSGTTTIDAYDGMESTGLRVKPSASAKTGSDIAKAESSAFDFWIYEADVVLFSDDDRDGYFYGIDLLFDADTIYGAADVYAAVYLSLDGGPWNEYAVTEDFTIFGASGSDEYVLVTELMSGYPTGSYDLLIELFDAYDGSYLAGLGPEDTSELAFLPLEDYDRDAPVIAAPVAVSHGGGGATSLWVLLPLAIVGIRRRTRTIE